MAESGKQSDELAQTATAAASTPHNAAKPLGDVLGRYRLERMLGEGGMGVVHAAFDPDLERRVALKVLRYTDGSDARQRLLREARAMARLNHPNVVAVHEVGTAGDRDYVAMELIDGETLADWLRVETRKPKRSAREITQAFIAAGRGLAAAHAAGLVHRDFKPHNVLCHRDGRVVVTDFGLARGVEMPVALETTLRPEKFATATSSSLSGLTMTGSVLGTPAYMAPEQWNGGVVGPPADQFAFCVALWEALTGERPFRGQTLEDLRREVQRGVDALDASKVPRRLRAPLRRGLQHEPDRRYPNMDALLAALTRADRSSGVFSIAWRSALVLATAGFLIMHGRGSGGVSCEPPAVELGSVWSAAIGATTPHELQAAFDKVAVRWTMARATACTAEPVARATQLHCLDGVLARFSAVRQGYSRVPNLDSEDASSELVDPSVCLTPAPPRLGLTATPDAVTAFELLGKADAASHADGGVPKPPVAPVQALVDRPDLDACAHTVALRALAETTMQFPAQRAALADAVQIAEQCEDDRVRADVLIANMPYQFELPVIGPRGEAAVRRAEAAVARVAQIDLTSRIDLIRAYIASQSERWADAIPRFQAAEEGLAAEGLRRTAVHIAIEEIEIHLTRSRPDDYRAVRAIVARWLPVARELHVSKNEIDLERDDAFARYVMGEIEAGHAELQRLWKQPAHLEDAHHHLEGDVVDAAGKPVAGAQVATAVRMTVDGIGVLPQYRLYMGDTDLRETVTDAHGHFSVDEAPLHGVVFAQTDHMRSLPVRATTDHVKLTLAPTRTITGTAALGGLTNTEAGVMAMTDLGAAFAVYAPIRPDGTFELGGVPTARINVGVGVDNRQFGTQVHPTAIAAGTAPITNLALAVPASGRTLDVLARSTLATPIDTAQVVVLPGHVKAATVGDLHGLLHNGLDVRFASHPVGENVPRPALDQLKSGDLWARFTNVAMGDVTVCTLGLAGDLNDEEAMRKLEAHLDEVEVRCVPVGGDAKVIVVPTAPQKRYE